VNYRVALIAAFAVLALAPAPGVAQSIPLGGFDLSGFYTIVQAAARNKTDDVRAMLMAGKSPDAADADGQTPLGFAASLGNVEMAQLLLKYNAPVDRRDQFGNTPLHWASQRGGLEIMRLLLAAKATVDIQNQQGITPLMMAASQGQVLAVRLLLQNGADPQKQDYTGRDAVGWAQGKPNVLQALHTAKAG
jgi:ankyrin repeat protein